MMNEDFDFYTAHQDEIVNGHLNEYVVIQNARVAGYYKDQMDAFDAMKSHELGTFMVKQCKPKGTDIITFHNSRLQFA
jgi:hypothetical protein